MTVLPCTVLPTLVAKSIVNHYADVLRVGRLHLNGVDITWDTSGTTELQLQSFVDRLYTSLRHKMSVSVPDSVLHQAMFYVCKSLSFNYAIFGYMLQLHESLGFMSTIETVDDGGLIVSYEVDTLRWPHVKVDLIWRRGDNILQISPDKGTRVVRGTLLSLGTEFPVPPPLDFIPEYEVKMTLKRVCVVPCCGSFLNDPVEPDEPLAADYPGERGEPVQVPRRCDRKRGGRKDDGQTALLA